MKNTIEGVGRGIAHAASPEGIGQGIAYKGANVLVNWLYNAGENQIRKMGWFGLKPKPSHVMVETAVNCKPEDVYLKSHAKGHLILLTKAQLEQLKIDQPAQNGKQAAS